MCGVVMSPWRRLLLARCRCQSANLVGVSRGNMACKELLSKDARKREKLGEPQRGVSRDRFQELHPEGRKLIHGWAERAVGQSNCDPLDSFEPFIFGWIALNGWACCVTGEDRDSDYLDAMLLDSGLDGKFKELMAGDLSTAAREFQSTWPIFSSKDIGYSVTSAGSRKEVIERYRAIDPPLGCKPPCAFLHRSRGEGVPVDWSHTLSAIYQVRCNLFHGYKGAYSENDVSIVSKAFRVLVHLLPMLIPSLTLPSKLGAVHAAEPTAESGISRAS